MSPRAVVIAVAFAIAATHFFSARFTRQMPDLEVYWRAAARARAGEPLYRISDGHYQFKYLPAFAVLVAPLGMAPLAEAKRIWFGISVFLLVALIGLSLTILPERREPRWLLAPTAMVAMGKFYGHELVLGQVNLLFAVLIVLAVLALRRRRELAAGLTLALAIVVKPYAILFVPWLAAIRRTRAVGAVLAGVAIAVLLPSVTYGVSGTVSLHQDWWATVRTSTTPNLLNQDNVSLAAMWSKWLGPGGTAAVLAAVTAGALLAVAALVVLGRQALAFPEALEASLLLVLVPLLSPQGWDYVFLVATPAVVLIVNYRDALPAAFRAVTLTALAAIGLSLFDVMGRANYARFMAWSIISLCFLVVASALADLRRRRIA